MYLSHYIELVALSDSMQTGAYCITNCIFPRPRVEESMLTLSPSPTTTHSVRPIVASDNDDNDDDDGVRWDRRVWTLRAMISSSNAIWQQ